MRPFSSWVTHGVINRRCYGKVIFFTSHHFNATTVSREVAQQVITKSPELFEKTGLAVLEESSGQISLTLYRKSSTEKGTYSREIYLPPPKKGSPWRLHEKPKGKVKIPPYPPAAGSYHYSRDAMEIWAPTTPVPKHFVLRGRETPVCSHVLL